MTRLLTLLLLILAWGLPVLAEDWPRYRGPRGDGMSRETPLAGAWPAEGPERLWTAQVGQGYSSPIAASGRVYVMGLAGGKETLWCFDAASGKVAWSQSYTGGWSGPYPGSRATPTIDGDRIYTYGGAGELVCRRLDDGKEQWSINVLKETGGGNLGWGTASTPLFTERLIYVQAGLGAAAPVAVAVDKDSGKIAWTSEARGMAADQGAGYAQPTLADVEGKPQLIVFASDRAFGMDPATGRTLWTIPWPTGYQVNAATPLFRDDRLLLHRAYGRGSIMLKPLPEGVEKIWENKKAQSRFQTPILDGDNLYLNSEGTIQCLDWKTGQLKWSEKDRELRLGFGGSMVKAGEFFILLSERGKLSLARLKPDGLERLAQTQLLDAREAWATPLIYHGRLYAKGTTDLVCVEIGKTD